MATLDVTNVQAVSFTAATTVTAPDGNTFPATTGNVYALDEGQTSLTVSVLTPVLCQLRPRVIKIESGAIPFFKVDEVRTPIV